VGERDNDRGGLGRIALLDAVGADHVIANGGQRVTIGVGGLGELEHVAGVERGAEPARLNEQHPDPEGATSPASDSDQPSSANFDAE